MTCFILFFSVGYFFTSTPALVQFFLVGWPIPGIQRKEKAAEKAKAKAAAKKAAEAEAQEEQENEDDEWWGEGEGYEEEEAWDVQ